jgi:SulP family sulfate permease
VLQLLGTTSPPPRVVVLDLSSSFRLSLPTLDTLTELHDELHQRGAELWLARVRGSATAELQASGLAHRPAQLYADLAAAAAAFTSTKPQAHPD